MTLIKKRLYCTCLMLSNKLKLSLGYTGKHVNWLNNNCQLTNSDPLHNERLSQ